MTQETVYEDLGLVRIRSVPAQWGHDLIVEHQKDGRWERSIDFNTMSDDYAYSNAREHARELTRRIQPTKDQKPV
jgi:hypothetical protein